MTEVRSTCPYCGVGCGITVKIEGDSPQFVGDTQHPANYGRLCSKGAAVGDTLSLDNRLLYPLIKGQRVNWETALASVAKSLRGVIAEHGPEAVGFYLSGQLLSEDYYVANKLMKGFIGSAHVDTNSRLCMSSSVAGHKRAFGEDVVPGNYQDLEQADLIVLVGSNLAWCHPVLYQRIRAARESNPQLKVVVIDPRRTATCDLADLHLAIQPGADTALFNGLLDYLATHNAIDPDYIAAHTQGFEAALASAQADAINVDRCGIDAATRQRFFDWFATTAKTVTIYSQGVNQSSYGTDKVNAIINCHLATGRIGRPGMGPFSVTGQPNAMGGREVGGLANTLAAHMDFEPQDIERVRRFWQAERMASGPGLKAVDLFRAVSQGRIKALWIMGTNPVVSLPDADGVRAALRGCPLVIVSEVNANTDTAAYAHILLPALAWGEKDGTVTNSERRISRQRAFLPPPGEARGDWWIVTQVARRLGFESAFHYASSHDIFREHAALSGFENHGARLFDISGLAHLSRRDYDELQPLHWPIPADRRSTSSARLFGAGHFATADGRACFIAIGQRQPANKLDADFPLVLNTGRIRDQWHTMTRTGKSARLSAHTPEPYAELHPTDAATHGIEDGALVQVESRWSKVVVRARLNEGQQVGSVFVPMHWSREYAKTGCIDAVVNPVTDPLSGQPESKHTPIAVKPYRPAWHGFLLSREALHLPATSYQVSARGAGFWRYELADTYKPVDWGDWVRSLCQKADWQWLDYSDLAAGRYRAAAIVQDRLQFCVFIAPQPLLPPREWLGGLFARHVLEDHERLSLLGGRANAQNDAGPVVCSCFQVGLNTLTRAIYEQGLTTPEALGEILKAGTNCGSCLPELRGLIAQCQRERAA